MKAMPKAIKATAVPSGAIRYQTDLTLKTMWSSWFTTGDIARVEMATRRFDHTCDRLDHETPESFGEKKSSETVTQNTLTA